MIQYSAGLALCSSSVRALIAAGIVGTFLSGGTAWAQGVPTSTGSSPDSVDANEIIVTANKREQNLAQVGLSVAAMSGDQLTNQRISNVADLALATPGLTFAPTLNSTPVYTLRGVGFYESSLASYPDVSLYVDQAPLPFPIMSSLTAFDLERVEVLKGPQGTLFGNNATGGAINFVAAKPTGVFRAGAELGYGRFNTFEASGFISGPISDTLSARVAVKSVNGDEWQRSYTRDDKNGKLDNVAGRLIIDWRPADALAISINLNGWRDQNDTQAPQRIAYIPQNDVSNPPAGGATAPVPFEQAAYPNSPLKARAADWTPSSPPSQDNRFKQATLRADYDFGGISLTSISGFSDLDFRNTTEGGGTALIDNDIRNDEGRIESFTQELRLSNGADDPLRWVIGANYEHSKVYEEINLAYRNTSSTYVNGIAQSTYTSDQVMKNYAVFANAEFDVADTVTLKAGIRQTKAKRRATSYNGDLAKYPFLPEDVNYSGVQGLTLVDFFNGIYGFLADLGAYGPDVTIPTIAPGGSIILDTRTNPDGTPVDPDTYLTADVVRTTLNEDSTSWSVGADFKPTDDLLLYANISKGYKAGSSPQLSGAIFDAYLPVEQESILAFEGGFKAQVFDRRMSISGAAFYYDYKNKQTRAKFVDPIFGGLDKLINIPKSRILGAELDVTARPVRGLSLSASATYLETKVIRYEGAIAIACLSSEHLAQLAA